MFDIFAETVIFTILNFIGGVIRWFFAAVFNLIFNTPKHPFKTYIFDSKTNKLIDDGGTGCVNIIIGVVFVVLVVMLIYSI
jgi:hypothetical protein